MSCRTPCRPATCRGNARVPCRWPQATNRSLPSRIQRPGHWRWSPAWRRRWRQQKGSPRRSRIVCAWRYRSARRALSNVHGHAQEGCRDLRAVRLLAAVVPGEQFLEFLVQFVLAAILRGRLEGIHGGTVIPAEGVDEL